MARLTPVLAALPLVALLLGAAPAREAAPYEPPEHSVQSPIFAILTPQQAARAADDGMQIDHDRPPEWQLAEHRRLARALAPLLPQRRGIVDAYVVSVAFDSDPVFGREARVAAKVLGRRYDAVGRTIVLAGSDGGGPSTLPQGSPATFGAALARVAELMNKREDVLVLYMTSHGAPIGIVYNDADQGFGAMSPAWLAQQLDRLGIERRLVIVSACYSGLFLPALSGEETAVLTASSGDRTSFGCRADSDWTFYGDALANHALRKAQPLETAAAEAASLVEQWEKRGGLTPSLPQVMIGVKAKAWLAQLDRRTPKMPTAPVGRPAVTLLEER